MILLRLIAYIIRFIFFVLLFSFIWGLIKKLFSNKKEKQIKKEKNKSSTLNRGAMVRDPICNTWVDPEIALKIRKNGTDYYFSSNECLEKFKQERGNS